MSQFHGRERGDAQDDESVNPRDEEISRAEEVEMQRELALELEEFEGGIQG